MEIHTFNTRYTLGYYKILEMFCRLKITYKENGYICSFLVFAVSEGLIKTILNSKTDINGGNKYLQQWNKTFI